jgi:PIN domain nuclease of toxin-antitoxin system
MAVKLSLGKLKLDAPLGKFLPEQLAANRFIAHGIDLRHVARVADLPFHHRDPFDRLLVAQALSDTLTIVSRDRVFSRYGVRRLW